MKKRYVLQCMACFGLEILLFSKQNNVMNVNIFSFTPVYVIYIIIVY